MKKQFLFLCAGYLLTQAAFAQNFIGHPGIYTLGSPGIPANATNYNQPFVDGGAVRIMWDSLETSLGVYDWTYLDNEIATAASYGKKVSINVVKMADWFCTAGAQCYDYIDKNPYHSTFGDTFTAPIPWDTFCISRHAALIQQMAIKYANDTNVTYINYIEKLITNELPDSVVTTSGTVPFQNEFTYDSDTVIARMKYLLDLHMSLFPNTPTWQEPSKIDFEYPVTGNPANYVAQQFANYGVATYPDRFGSWREDLSGCSPPAVISSNSQWKIMEQNPCKIGAQMVWSVQDGPDRMNQCGISPNTEAVVLDSAIKRGLALGMIYMEIYKADVTDAGLLATLQEGHDSLIAKHQSCNPVTTGLTENGAAQNQISAVIYPNPSSGTTTLEFSLSEPTFTTIEIFNLLGEKVITVHNGNLASGKHKIGFDAGKLERGIYFINIKTISGTSSQKLVVSK